MRITLLKKLWLLVVFLCLSGCDQDPGAPPQAVDLAVAAQLWNTPEMQWRYGPSVVGSRYVLEAE